MAYLYPYGDTQQLNLDWLIEQWNEVKSQIDGSLQAEIDRVEAAITDLLTARDEAVAAQTAAQASAQAAAGSASTASGAASTATAQAQAANASAATAGAHASDAQGYAATAQQAAQAANNSAGAAAVSEGNARNSETAAAGSSSAAAGNALYAEGYAKGTQNGTPVSSGSPYYENNAKYYADQAAQDASDAADSAQDAQDVLDSIPEDYSELSADVVTLKNDFPAIDPYMALITELYPKNADFNVYARRVKISNSQITLSVSSGGSNNRGIFISGTTPFKGITGSVANNIPNMNNLLPISLLTGINTLAAKREKDKTILFAIGLAFYNVDAADNITYISSYGRNCATYVNSGIFEIPSNATHFALYIYSASNAIIDSTKIWLTLTRTSTPATLITTNTEETYTATKAYSVNDYIKIQNTLYRVTANIANGGAITPNTNVTEVTVCGQLTQIRNNQ